MTRLIAGAAWIALMAGLLGACAKTEPAQGAAKPGVDTAKIAEAIKADAAQRIADVDAHDAAKFASHYAADAVSIFHGRPNDVGAAAIEAGAKAYEPDLHVTLSNPTVAVAASGDLAVYHSDTAATFTDLKTRKPMKTTNNDLLVYKLQPDGSWKIEWSVVSDTGPTHAAASAPAAPKT